MKACRVMRAGAADVRQHCKRYARRDNRALHRIVRLLFTFECDIDRAQHDAVGLQHH
jgi:hypothetical protein